MPNLKDYTNVGVITSTDELIVDRSGSTVNVTVGDMAAQSSNAVAITGGTIAGITNLAVADGGTGASTAADARTNLGLAVGTDIQAYDAQLADIAALAVTDGNIIVGNGTNWVAESGATARTSLGVAIGTDVQAYSAALDGTTASFTTADETKLDGIEASADVTDEINVKAALDGATISVATVATGDKVIIQDVDDSDNLKYVTAQSIADLASSGLPALSATDTGSILQVNAGGTGYDLLAAGTAGKYLMSNGADAAVSYESLLGWSVISQTVISTSVTNVAFESLGTYDNYRITCTDLGYDSNTTMECQFKIGGSWVTSGYTGTWSGSDIILASITNGLYIGRCSGATGDWDISLHLGDLLGDGNKGGIAKSVLLTTAKVGVGGGFLANTGVVEGVRITNNNLSGNLTAGTVTLEGFKGA